MTDQLPAHLQQSVLGILCFTDKAKLVRGILPLSVWETERSLGELMQYVYAYLDAYDKEPGSQTYDIVEALDTIKPEQKQLLVQLLQTCESRIDEKFNYDYVFDQLAKFARLSVWRDAIQKSAELIAKGRVDEVENIITDAQKLRITQFDPGIGLDHVVDKLYQASDGQDANDQVFLGIDEFDKVGIHPKRGQLFVLLAKIKAGKTFFMVHVGKKALMEQKRVIHITLEMSAIDVGSRYLQSCLSYTNYEMQTQRTLWRIENGILKNENFPARPSLKTHSGISQAKTDLEKMAYLGTNLRIKEFPSGTLTIPALKAYLQSLIASGFDWDVMLLDYPNLMATSTDKDQVRHQLNKIVVDIRGILQEMNRIGVIVLQTTRNNNSSESDTEATDVAEDFSSMKTADNVISYSQTPQEYELGFARLKAILARHARKDVKVIISQDYDTAQFVMSSCGYKTQLMQAVRDQGKKQQEENSV